MRVVERLFAFNVELGLPTRGCGEIGVKDEHIETLADLAHADFAHPNNPKPVSRGRL
jgi:alcohol dehydrogenase class IV